MIERQKVYIFRKENPKEQVVGNFSATATAAAVGAASVNDSAAALSLCPR